MILISTGLDLMNIRLTLIFILVSSLVSANSEVVNISGRVFSASSLEPLVNAHILEDGFLLAISNNAGEFQFKSSKEVVTISISYVGFKAYETKLNTASSGYIEVGMEELELEEATVLADNSELIQLEPRAVENFTVFAGKKTDLISLDKQLMNSASANPRQAFSRVSGLNIWETDGGGMQLSIGSRGLDPNRSAHFNIRQNGADISAEPLGYPEAYYSPNLKSVDRIELIRGAASLQYGPQFGGMLNFKMKEGNSSKKLNINTDLSVGSFNLHQEYLSIDGQINKWNYFISASNKGGDGFMENSQFRQTSIYSGLKFLKSKNSTLKFTLAYMDYLAQQPGGLTDSQFEESPYTSTRNRNWFDVNWFTASAEWNYRLSSNTSLESKFFLLNSSRTSIGFLEAPNRIDTEEERDIIHGEYDNWGNETRIKSLHSVAKHHATLVCGTRLFVGKTISQQLAGNDLVETIPLSEVKSTTPLSDYEFKNFNASVFLEEVVFLNKWKVTPGVRLELINTGFSGEYTDIQTDGAGNVLPGYPNTISTRGNQIRSIFLFGLGIQRKLGESAAALLRPKQAIDPTIKDESGFSADLEFKIKVKTWLRTSVDFYMLLYRDKIGTVFTTFNDPLLGNRLLSLRTNVNNGFSHGLDYSLEIDLLKALNLKSENWLLLPFGSVSYNQSQYKGTESVYAELTNGNQIEKAPVFQYKSGTRIQRNNISLELLYTYVGEQFSDATNSIYDATGIVGLVPNYSILDVSAKYGYKNFTLSVNVNNALNSVYFARRASSYPGPGIITGAPRNFGFSLGLTF